MFRLDLLPSLFLKLFSKTFFFPSQVIAVHWRKVLFCSFPPAKQLVDCRLTLPGRLTYFNPVKYLILGSKERREGGREKERDEGREKVREG